eukprot:g4203.t1
MKKKKKEKVMMKGKEGQKKGTSATSSSSAEGKEEEERSEEKRTFESLGVLKPLCEAASVLNWTHATPIQRESLPYSLNDRDVIGVAETGSGKTGAFTIPILQSLLKHPQRMFAIVLAPTRELAFQISDQVNALGSTIDVKCVTVVGGVDIMTQAIALAKRPHVIVATPGRLVDHLEHTKGFSLRTIKFLVLDEADRMLGLDFEEEITTILQLLPRDRRTLLFSATMTNKVKKLQRAALVNPVKVAVNSKYTTVKTLVQQYLFIPEKYKDCYLAFILNEYAGQTALAFVRTCAECQRVGIFLRNLGFKAVSLHGKMTQPKRLAALHKFKAGSRSILIATDVASRGLDIPSVDLVLNLSIPANAKDYVHRVGRTARAGRSGRAISFVTQYDVEAYQRIERLIEKKLALYPTDKETVMVMLERVEEAQRIAAQEMRECERKKRGKGKKRGHRGRGGDDAESEALHGMLRRKKVRSMGRGGGGAGRRSMGRGGGGAGRRR